MVYILCKQSCHWRLSYHQRPDFQVLWLGFVTSVPGFCAASLHAYLCPSSLEYLIQKLVVGRGESPWSYWKETCRPECLKQLFFLTRIFRACNLALMGPQFYIISCLKLSKQHDIYSVCHECGFAAGLLRVTKKTSVSAIWSLEYVNKQGLLWCLNLHALAISSKYNQEP